MTSNTPKPIRVGLVGFGNIGTGVVRYLRANRLLIEERLGRPLELARIADIDTTRDRGIELEPGLLVADAQVILDDPTLDIVIELIGGVGFAREFVEKALAAGKHVVTANKALLATHGADLMALAKEKGLVIGAEASVGAGIPLIRSMHQSLAPNRFSSVAGIVNGTCNYILSEMEEYEKPFDEVLAEAQKLGYAEPDPTFDVEGTDAAHKIAILASLAFGQDIRLDDVVAEGISRVKPEHIRQAARMGGRIKLVAAAMQTPRGEVDVWVAPTLVWSEGQLGTVNGPFNAVLLEGDPIGRVMVYGRGAGQESTSSGILSDVMAIAAAIDKGGLGREAVLPWPTGYKSRLDPAMSTGEFILCVETGDSPEAMSAVVGEIERSALPIRRMEIQPATTITPSVKVGGHSFWIETERAQYGRVSEAVYRLVKSNIPREKPLILRREFGY